MRCRSACGLVPPRSLLPPGKKTPLPLHARGVGRRSARKARYCSAGTAQVRSSAAAGPSAAAALWPKCGTAARRSRAGSGPSGAPSAAGACAVPGNSVAAHRARVSAAAGERRDRGGHAVGAVVRSSPGDAVECSSLRLAWAVSAWPPSPRGAGARRDRRSAYWLWAEAAEAGEAAER
ncbi:uncharacterized protein ACIBXB_008349 isoform 1-T1 [Morphnus guianensis]